MIERPPLSPSDFFCNAAAREAGLTEQFWFDAHTRWHEALHNDPKISFDSIDTPRTIRMPFRDGHVDVLVRNQPDGGEYFAVRFTAFPADEEPTPRQISRWYMDEESRSVMGEGVLLDANFNW